MVQKPTTSLPMRSVKDWTASAHDGQSVTISEIISRVQRIIIVVGMCSSHMLMAISLSVTFVKSFLFSTSHKCVFLGKGDGSV